MENDRKRTALLQAWPPLLVIAASLAPYLGILDAPFVFDDIKLVKENQFLRLGLKDAGKVFEALDVTARRWDDEELRPNYRPLRFLSYLVDYQLTRWWFKGSPPENPPEFFFHLSNLLLHSLNSLLLFFLARRLFGALFAQDASGGGKGEGRSMFAALSTALFFALHPLQTEAVTYVSGRRDVLSTFFFLLALWVYLRARPDRPSALDIVLVPALFAAGFFSKEMAITLPAALLLVDRVRGVAWSGRRAALHALTWLVAALLVAITLFNPRLIAKPDGSGAGSLVLAAFTAARYVSRYLGLLLCPVSQSVDYSFDAVSESTSLCAPWTTLPSVLFVVLLISLAAGSLLRRRGSPPRSVLALGILWFVGTLVPVLQFVPIAERFAERFSYLPSIGVFLVLALFLERAWRLERVLGWGLLGMLSLLCLVGAVHRNTDWQSPLSLWASAVEAQPRSARAHLGLAHALKDSGRFREAVEEYTRALEIFEKKPEVPLHHGFILQALTMRGGLYGVLAKADPALASRAVEDYRRVLASTDTDGTVIQSSPKHTAVHFDLAGFLLEEGKRAEAKKEYQHVIQLGAPLQLVSASHYLLAKIAVLERDSSSARASFKAAYDTASREGSLRFQWAVEFGEILIGEKDLDGAWAILVRALNDGARGEERLALLLREAKVLDRRKDLDGCVDLLKKMLREAPDYVPALITLAGIETNLGRFEEAEEHYRIVLRSNPANVESLQGLQNLKLQKLALKNEGEGGKSREETSILAALEKKGEEHVNGGELLAAREVFGNLLRRSASGHDRKYQMKAMRELSSVEDKLGRFSEAEEYLQRLLDLEPSDAEAWRQMADLQLRRFNNRELAQRDYERYLSLLPEGKEADPKVYINLASLLSKTNPELALSYCERARRAGFDPPQAKKLLGYLYADTGRWEKSLEAFNRYLESPGEDDPVDRADRDAVRAFIKESVLPRLSNK